MTRRPRAYHQRGSAALTTAIATPLVLSLLALTIAGGRIVLAQSATDAAARAAARTASLTADPTAGESAARDAATSSLRDSGLSCTQVDVALNTGRLSAPVGQSATVQATVSCTAPLSDLALPGLGGSKTLTSTMTSTVDRWRAREAGDT
ncbi:TadE/TadG family type IV pilus assembly protein [Streptomyces niveus]|uniref:TadE/TadG family type IV pilus assembly protein n=1 Tax=Streptomyces niveus TaxID=193462 RepID=UPI003683CF15